MQEAHSIEKIASVILSSADKSRKFIRINVTSRKTFGCNQKTDGAFSFLNIYYRFELFKHLS